MSDAKDEELQAFAAWMDPSTVVVEPLCPAGTAEDKSFDLLTSPAVEWSIHDPVRQMTVP